MINFADEIKNRVTMEDICDAYGIDVNRQHKALCPFHNDSHASMHVYGGSRGYWCYTCGQGGSVIDFVMRLFGLSFQDACQKINDDLHLGLPIGRHLTLRQMREAEEAARARKAKLDAERAEHQRLLDDYHAALDEYTRLDAQRIKYAPQFAERDFSDFYVEAVKNIPYAENALSEAETRLYEYEYHRSGNS